MFSAPIIVNVTFDFVNRLIQPEDIIFHGGDVSFFTPMMPKEDEMYGLRYLADALYERFPNNLIFPTIGNHDTSPINSMGDPKGSWVWLMNDTIAAWRRILPLDLINQAREGLYYAARPRQGLTLLVLNSLLFHTENLPVRWGLDAGAMKRELDWMDAQMKEAEARGDTVWIFSHLFFGHHENVLDIETLFGLEVVFPEALARFVSIVRKYQDHITLMAFGHQHDAGLRFIQKTDDPSSPVAGVQLLGPSISPSSGKSPSFWQYVMDDATHTLLSIEQYTFNLTLANQGNPQWVHSASFPRDFGIPDLSIPSWEKGVFRRSLTDPKFVSDTRATFRSSSNPSSCRSRCMHQYLCATLYSSRTPYRKCLDV